MKMKKNPKKQRKLVAVWLYNGESRQCTMFVYFFVCTDLFFQLIGVVVCCQAVVAQGARPSQPGPRSRAAAQKHVGGGAKCGGWGSGGGDASEAMCRTWAPPQPGQLRLGGLLPSPGPPFSSPLAGEPGAPRKMWRKGRGWRVKTSDFFGWGDGVELTKHDQRWLVGVVCWLVVNSVREGGCCRVVGGGRVEGEMGGCGGAFARPYE